MNTVNKLKIKKGDTVKVKAGKDKGKEGKVLQIFPALERVAVDGVNLLKKHLKAGRGNEKGQKVEYPSPLHVSNLAIICPKCKKASRVKLQRLTEKAGRVRICRACQETID